MSLPWSQLNPELLALFTELGKRTVTLGSGETKVVGPAADHAGRSQRIMGVSARQALSMQVLSTRGAIAAWSALDVDEEAGTSVERTESDRFVTLRLRCDAIENSDKAWAWETIDNIRQRLRRPSVTARLLALDCDLQHCLDAKEIDVSIRGKRLHCVVMDVVLLVHVSESSEPIEGGWIDSVFLTSDKIRDVDGEPVEDSLQMNEVEVDGTLDEP